MKATIEVARKGSAVRTARQQLSAALERNEDASVSVPYEAVEIVLPLAQVA
jgi:hypothetical protein